MSQVIYLVDSFAHAPFKGNPAGVCPLEAPAEEKWMQSVAMEMNQAETAFFWPDGNAWGLRWFTPAVEVDLCGHATLASAHIMYQSGILAPSEEARFNTKSGELVCTKTDTGISMDFPSEIPQEATRQSVANAIGIEPVWFAANRMDWFLVLESEEQVCSVNPDFAEITRLGKRGVIVTAKSETDNIDFVSRFFAPQSGVPEDHVTGSAHCALGPYWAKLLGKQTVTGYQASTRGGYVNIDVRGDRVFLSGEAKTTLVGELNS